MALTIRQQVSLQPYNTLALAANAAYFASINSEAQLLEALEFAEQQGIAVMVLGGGSNVVLANDFPGLVLVMKIPGVEPIASNSSEQGSLLKIGAGENWHQLVEYCLAHKLRGLENLALIPGTVGAAPIQNIGAYGVELQQLLHSLRGWDCQQGCWRELSASDGQFAYRDSIFKRALKGRFIITAVTLRLSDHWQAKTTYSALSNYLQQHSITDPSAEQIVEAVVAIRRSKLPDPAMIANAGSFFKNPLIPASQAAHLREDFPDMVQYPQSDGRVKLAAGWLLDQAGWKGRSMGPVAMHDQQALVLVNKGGADASELLQLVEAIKADIKQRYGVMLEVEPAIL